MRRPWRRGEDAGDEGVQRLRELAEQAERAQPERPPPPPEGISPPYAHVPAVPPFAAELPTVAKPLRSLRWAWAMVTGLFLAVLVMMVVSRIEAIGPQGWTSEADPGKRLTGWPAAPEGVGSGPLGQPPTDVPDADSYAFMATQEDSDEPVTYDPCAPIHYVVNDRQAFDGADEELAAAVAEIEEATGLVFVNDGATDEAPVLKRAFQEKRYGKSWSPVLIAWSDKYELGRLKTALGVGGSGAISAGGRKWFVSGGVTLNGPRLRQLYDGKNGRAQVRAVIMHELGHLVGLTHVTAPGEIMRPGVRDKTAAWGPGDRAGLAQLGTAPCITY